MPYITKFSSTIIPYNEGSEVFPSCISIYSNSIKVMHDLHFF